MKTILLVANFFIQDHFIDETHIYTLKGCYKQKEYIVVYVGDKLPIDDNYKFYAEIEADCTTSIHGPYYCEAININF